MADSKLSALTELAAAPAVGDELYIRDISEAAASESKRITIANLFAIPITLGGNMTVAGYAFDAGAGDAQINTTGDNKGLLIQVTSLNAYGAFITGRHISETPAGGDVLMALQFYGNDAGLNDTRYGRQHFNITNPAEGSETADMALYLYDGGAENLALTCSGAGGLAVDLDNGGTDYYVGLFDEYDDALLIRQGIQENNRELLTDIGVFDRKDTGSGYMMKIQPMVRLLAGGIYQSRQLIDQNKEELIERIETLENKLMLLGAG